MHYNPNRISISASIRVEGELVPRHALVQARGRPILLHKKRAHNSCRPNLPSLLHCFHGALVKKAQYCRRGRNDQDKNSDLLPVCHHGNLPRRLPDAYLAIKSVVVPIVRSWYVGSLLINQYCMHGLHPSYLLWYSNL